LSDLTTTTAREVPARRARGADLAPAPQDYLKAIHRITDGGAAARAGTKAIAAELKVSPPSVSAMLDRLAAEGMVDYVHYGGATLTAEGRRTALRVIRRHRLLELYLSRFLGLGWDEVHEEAEELEHVLSARLEGAIDRALGHPSVDPHGDPIPAVDGTIAATDHHALWGLEAGARAEVRRVSDLDAELLRHLRQMGIVPGARVSRVSRETGGVLRLTVGRRSVALGRDAAEKVFVEVLP
jgi:DtxR family Mn-dependent transcriptional regulator